MRVKIERMQNRIYAEVIVPFREKTYEYDGEQIHYLLFEKKKSDVLIIGFQAAMGDRPRYNYIKSLEQFKVNKLFIQDDFTKGGNYYLGRNNKYNIEEGVFHLINKVIDKTNATKVIFIGSSKGGYAAINFGIEYPNSTMIVAAPQYYLGKYMKETKYFNRGLEDIIGKRMAAIQEEDIDALNKRLRDKIRKNVYGDTQKVYLHCSVNEITYREHDEDLIRDLKAANISVSFDRAWYEKHNDLRYHFPDYLKKCTDETIRNNKEER